MLNDWAVRWGIPAEALADLRTQLAPSADAAAARAGTEADIVNRVRLAASEAGWTLFRNNVGACYDATGRFIRYGLANDSAQLNASLKSSDLIGIRPVRIDVTHIGRVFGQFVALECKRPGWIPAASGGTAREQAQARFLALIAANGGHARFSTGGL